MVVIMLVAAIGFVVAIIFKYFIIAVIVSFIIYAILAQKDKK
jgi:hypothetical protein